MEFRPVDQVFHVVGSVMLFLGLSWLTGWEKVVPCVLAVLGLSVMMFGIAGMAVTMSKKK